MCLGVVDMLSIRGRCWLEEGVEKRERVSTIAEAGEFEKHRERGGKVVGML